MEKILIIEDDDAIRTGLKYYLEQEKYDILTAGSIEEARKKIINSDLVLLDVNLPDGSGFDFFSEIKRIKKVPIIFLTANDQEVSIVMGLDMGAEDYITKPFRARELVSRIKNTLRRIKGGTNNQIKLNEITIDLNQGKVMKNGKDLFLTTLEYKILITLALNPNHVFTREKLLADIWDVNEEYVNDNTLTVYIKRIREKIENNPSDPKIILTVRGLGYKIGEFNV